MFARVPLRAARSWASRASASATGACRAVHLETRARVASTSTVTPVLQRRYASEVVPEQHAEAALDSAAASVTAASGHEMEGIEAFEDMEGIEGFEEDSEEVDLANVSEEEIAAAIIHGRSLFEPIYHPRTYGIPAAIIHLRSYHVPLLQLFSHFVTHTASALAIPISKPAPLPIQRSLWTVLKGPFVHKKSQENFDRKTHKRVIKAWDTDPEVIERWVRYLEKHPLAGVGMRVVRWERAPLGVGKKIFDAVSKKMEEARLQRPDVQVGALAGKIIQQEMAAAATEQELVQKPSAATNQQETVQETPVTSDSNADVAQEIKPPTSA